MPSKPILIVNSLTKIFEPRGLFIRKQQNYKAVDTVSFTISSGEIVGLLGPNGSGKTTTLHMLLGTITPTSGSIDYFGKDFLTHRSELLQEIGFGSSYIKFTPRLTIYENLDIFARLYGLNGQQRARTIEQLLKFFDMWTIRDKEVASLSSGQITRVVLCKAFLSNPKIVLLDEPTASLDSSISTDIREFITQQCKEHGTSVLIASHNLHEIHQMCTRTLTMHNGKIIADNYVHQNTQPMYTHVIQGSTP